MKIIDIKTTVLSMPMKKPFVDAGGTTMKNINWIVVKIFTDEDITGNSYVMLFDSGVRVIKTVIDEELRKVVINEDPLCIERILKRFWIETSDYGHTGVSMWGISAIDVALWDIIGKVANMPIYKLLGGSQDKVMACASGGSLSSGIKETVGEMVGYVKQGFKAVKIKIGSQNPDDDLKRVKAVRDAIGDDVRLMVDANQSWNTHTAIRMGRRLEKYNIFWLEEPVPITDIESSIQVAAALDIPINSGENEYTHYPFKDLIAKKAADIIQPDLMRVGGVSGWMKIAAMAEAWNLPLCSHIYKEMDIHLLAARPNSLMLEYFPQFSLDNLLLEPLQVEDGYVYVPQRPGFGLEFSKEAIQKYSVG